MHYAHRSDVLVLALPRGGVPVGFIVAEALHAPLDVMLVRKLGVPGHEELAMGAIASGGLIVLDRERIDMLNIPQKQVDAVIDIERRELDRREAAFRGEKPFPNVEGQTVILVDDGLATGASMRAAAQALRLRNPGRIVVAVPVGAAETCESLHTDADETVCAIQPDPFIAVGLWYADFEQTSDTEVRDLLERARHDYEHTRPKQAA